VFYLAINIGVKILGPVFGFVLGSLCTSIYVDPLVEPDVTPKDPRWIGAWWLGNVNLTFGSTFRCTNRLLSLSVK